jgi:DNA-binding response OmpR family regulator
MGKGSAVQQPAVNSSTILVVDDDTEIRSMVSHHLEANGFTVLLAEDGFRAVNVFTENRATIDLVLMDVKMPKRSGWEAGAEILRQHPNMKILFMSGFTEEIPAAGLKDVEVLAKPFDLRKLTAKIRQLFEA